MWVVLGGANIGQVYPVRTLWRKPFSGEGGTLLIELRVNQIRVNPNQIYGESVTMKSVNLRRLSEHSVYRLTDLYRLYIGGI